MVTDEKIAVIFIGIPASGKSTFFEHTFKGKYEHVNLDTLHKRSKEQALLNSCILEGKPFVVDNTNPTKEDRARYVSVAKAAGYRVDGYFFQSVISDCLERNANRDGKAKVPDVAIRAVSSKLEMPSIDEGFDALFFVKIIDGEFVVDNWKDTQA